MKKNRNSKTIFAICIALIAMVAGTNHVVSRCCDVDKMTSDAGKALSAVTSAKDNAAFAVQGDAKSGKGQSGERAKREREGLERPAKLHGKEEIMLMKSQFVISYDSKTLCPNYVCWKLDADRIGGKVKRTDNFHADPALSGCVVVEKSDYSGSGYDRGHMCPAGDNKNSEVAMDESFCMTNICPQNQNLNRGAWNELEQHCRDWVRDYGTLYICCGPIFDSDKPRKIGTRKDAKISVPDRFFKVILYLGRVPKAIGFIYPNEPCDKDIRDYAVSVDEVEEITGMDFFYQLDNKQEKKLEKECNPAAWGI